MNNEHISSAEMTAYWRCKYPLISGDNLSVKLTSYEGIEKAHEFEKKYRYPLIGRKISVRAGWCLEQATEMLLTGKYDSCISLGSGFSLLTYNVALSIDGKIPNIRFIDVDLSEMILLRKERITRLLPGLLTATIANKLETAAINLEMTYQQDRKFNDLFPGCNAPLFIMEGIIYFLSKDCVQWIYDGIANYFNAAVVFDYWPEDGPGESKCFKRVLESIVDFLPEKVQGLLSYDELMRLCRSNLMKDVSLQEVENVLSKKLNERPQLIIKDEFIPVRLAVVATA